MCELCMNFFVLSNRWPKISLNCIFVSSVKSFTVRKINLFLSNKQLAYAADFVTATIQRIIRLVLISLFYVPFFPLLLFYKGIFFSFLSWHSSSIVLLLLLFATAILMQSSVFYLLSHKSCFFILFHSSLRICVVIVV